MESPHPHRRRGAALMLSLWALFLLSAMVISWVLVIDSRLAMSGNANRGLEAEAMACSGAEVAMQPSIKPGSPALEGEFGPGQRYETRLTGEGGRINLNFLLGKLLTNDPVAREFLIRYLEIKGIDLNERERMIDTLLDWFDADNLVRLNGAEEEEGYKPPNSWPKPVSEIDELKKIKGWEEFTSTKDWDSDLTLYTVPGPINLAWASRDVLMALGLSEDRVDQFLTMRPGPDGINGTNDDAFRSQDEAFGVLGVTQQQLAGLAVFSASASEQVWRVISVGESRGVERTVQMIIQKSPGAIVAAVKSWKEL
jgi:general secretion pathway protein K